MSLGLFIGRLNPPHIWHIQTIEKALKENEKVIVFLWSPIFNDEKNPLNFKERKDILQSKFKENITFLEIIDTKSNILWVYNIYKLLYENWFWIKNINFYWGDFKHDSAYLVLKEHEEKLLNYKINYIENTRKNSSINFNWKKYEISATNLRESLSQWNYELAKQFCDIEIFEIIKGYLK